MAEPSPTPEPPLVVRVEEELPLVLPVASPAPKLPRPGFVEACILTLGFGAVLFGTVFAVVGLAVLYVLAVGGMDALKTQPGAEPGSVPAVPQVLRAAVAWSFPAGYAAGLVYAVVVFRLVAGPGWTREVGLRRLPPVHLGLGLLALPAFVILSDTLAQALAEWVDPFVYRLTGLGGLGDPGRALQDTFSGFHWSFAVFAIGVGPGIVEEVWCRGFLGRGLVGRYGWTVGVALTSLFFGVLHLWPPSYVLTTAVMGACLHYTYAVSRSLWVPIAIHLVNNSVAALAAMKAFPTEGMERAGAEHPFLVVALAAYLLLFVGAAMWTYRCRLVPPGEANAAPIRRGVMVPPAGHGVAFEKHTCGAGRGWLGGMCLASAGGSAGVLLWLFFG
ncbi:MAG: hypothetical protein JWO38_879 [Gemmataceae bacterium]|nr:hypothetical protein [Gemmataceae bacterium]